MSITPMIYLDGRGVTRDEVLRVAQQAATGFEQLGVSEGDTVALAPGDSCVVESVGRHPEWDAAEFYIGGRRTSSRVKGWK